MKQLELERMSVDDLWKLHIDVGEALAVRLVAEKELLDERLRQLNSRPGFDRRIGTSERRHYPPVYPKFQNPDDPKETWSGRGKQPRWLAQQLGSGHAIDEFKIQMAAE